MSSWAPTKAEAERRSLHEAMLVGTKLGTIPLIARNRVVRIAESRGWREAEFASRKHCRILCRALYDARERLCAEGKVTGLDEIDRCWHELAAPLGPESRRRSPASIATHTTHAQE